MHARELIGEYVLRTTPTKTKMGHDDWSFSTEPVLIINATDTHVYCEKWNQSTRDLTILNSKWVEDWVLYEPKPREIQ